DVEGDPPRFEEGEIEDLVEEPGKALALLADDAEEMARLLGADVGCLLEDLGKGADRGHRRAQLVADLREEGVLERVDPLELVVGVAELAGGFLEFGRLRRQT